MKRKTIVIGLDGATWTSLRPWIGRGLLPGFKAGMEGGVFGTLLSTIPCRTGTGTAAFYTGKNHDRWQGLDFSAFDPDIVTYEKIREKTKAVWDILGGSGLKSAVLNVPATNPPTETNGVLLSGFAVSEKDEYTFPKEFKKRVEGFHSERETFLALVLGKRTMENKTALFDLYTQTLKNRYKIIRDVLRDEQYDFSIFWVDEFDAMQHAFWGKEEYLLPFFQEVDKILQDLIQLRDKYNLIIMSDHGFDARPIYEFFPKTWLKKEGYLKLKGNLFQRWSTQAINSLIIKIPFPYRYRSLDYFSFLVNEIKKKLGFLKKFQSHQAQGVNLGHYWHRNKKGAVKSESKVRGIDWKKTIATNHDFWGIKILRENLKDDYEKIRKEIMEKMKDLRDKNGEKIIKHIFKREEIFKSDNAAEKYPDIVYLPTSKFQPTGFLPFAITQNRVIASGSRLSIGAHMTIREGIFIALGPDIKKKGDIGERDILDLTPTILHLFGAPVPEDMDGRVLNEILE